MGPLRVRGLPPLNAQWEPVVGKRREGHIQPNVSGTYCGDGSGYGQTEITSRRATWAVLGPRVAHIGYDDNAEISVIETANWSRGQIDGWFPTVPRGELTALAEFFGAAGDNSTYVGDCRYVLDAVSEGIPPSTAPPAARTRTCGDA